MQETFKFTPKKWGVFNKGWCVKFELLHVSTFEQPHFPLTFSGMQSLTTMMTNVFTRDL